MTRPIRVLLADDKQIMRDGLRAYLEREDDVEVVAEARDGREALRLCERIVPDVVVMDIAMADMNGIEATRQILRARPGVRVVALSNHSDRRYVYAMLDAGALAYVDKGAAGVELLRAVRSVAAGQSYLSPSVTECVVARSRGATPAHDGPEVLGAREREVLQLIAEGCSTAEIAARLHIAAKTVETHRRNIGRKLGLAGVAQLTRYALRHGLSSLDP